MLDNPGAVGPAAHTDDGNYGVSYDLRYTLVNTGQQARAVALIFSAPRAGKTPQGHRPAGGELTIPLKVNGVIVPVRVDQRGEGRVVATFSVPSGGQQAVRMEFTNFGNNFPPAELEFRPGT